MNDVDKILELAAQTAGPDLNAIRLEVQAHFDRLSLKLDSIEQKIDQRFEQLMTEIRNFSLSVAANQEEILRAIERLRVGENAPAPKTNWTN